MYLKIFIRTMARRARNINKENTLRITNQANQQKQPNSIDRISTGDKEIVVNVKKKLYKHVHHASNVATFESLNLRNDVLQGLDILKVVQPTVIQLLAMPLIMERKNIFCAAQTGSGKTLVYAAPIVNSLQNEYEEGYIGRLSRPRAIIVAPSRELAQQILKFFKSFSHHAPFRSIALIGQKKWVKDYVKGLVDVIVGTPTAVLRYHEKGMLHFSDLQYLVLDEADTLLDQNFKESTLSLIQACHVDGSVNSLKPKVQCICTAATLPGKGVLSGYQNVIPSLEICQSNLHKVLPNVKHTFIKSIQNKKADLLLLHLLNRKSNKKCIIFCNTSKSCNWLSKQLLEKQIDHSKLHGNMSAQMRLKEFGSFQTGLSNILVSTDIASRGLDTNVSLVINFDCPFTPSDYIHRSGRTGRAGQMYAGHGEVITYITQNKEVAFARKIQNAAEKNESLEDIRSKKNSLKTNYIKSMQKFKELEDTKV